MKAYDLDNVDYNGGNCGIGHKVLEDIMKPTMKNQYNLVISLWNGGNVTKMEVLYSEIHMILLYWLATNVMFEVDYYFG